MTTTGAEAAADAPPRRRRWPAVLALVLVLVAPVAWWAWGQRAEDGLAAGWDLDCGDTKVGTYEGRPAILGRAGWSCRVVVRVINDTGHRVRVTAAESAILGPGGGGEIQGLPGTDGLVGEPTGISPDDDISVRWPVDLPLDAHTTGVLRLRVGWREDGCNDGGTLGLPRFPTLAIRSLGRTVRIKSGQDLLLRTFTDQHDEVACPG